MFERSKSNFECFKGFVDTDFDGDKDKRKPLASYYVIAWGNTVNWKAKLQSEVSLSSIEAEYIAATKATKEAFWLKGIVNELGIGQS